MLHAKFMLMVLGALAMIAPAFAQGGARSAAAAQPFDTVNVTVPLPPGDPSFAAFRQTLATVARDRVFEALARNVEPHRFFWDRDFAHGFNAIGVNADGFDPKRTGAENLASAIRLEAGFGAGWQMLADFAAEPTATDIPTMPGVLCAPGQPSFDQDDFDRLVNSTRSSPAEWVYPGAASLDLRTAPRLPSSTVATLGSYFVRVIGFETVAANADPLHTAWAHIAAPNGKIGYAPPGTLNGLAAARLCYIKDITGRWRITGFIGGAN